MRRIDGAHARPRGPPGGVWGGFNTNTKDHYLRSSTPMGRRPGEFSSHFCNAYNLHHKKRIKKNKRFMLVKRTILKIHLPSVSILGPIFSTCSSFEHQYTSRSIQLHLGNAVRHMSDPLRDPIFCTKIPPRSGF